jgi:hypothetical protein
MEEILKDVSWLAVITGTIVSFLVGWLWYSPKLFGVKWAEGVGVELGHADAMPKAAMISQFLGLFLMSWFVAVTAASEHLLTVILATLAFTVMGYANGAFAGNAPYARNVNAGYWLVALVIMVLCNGLF